MFFRSADQTLLHHSSCPAVRPHYSSSSSRVSAALVSRKAVRGSKPALSPEPESFLTACTWARVRGSDLHLHSCSPAEPSEGFCILHLLLLAGSKRGTWTPSWPLRFSISAEPTQPPDHPPELLPFCRFLGRTPELSLMFANVLFPSFLHSGSSPRPGHETRNIEETNETLQLELNYNQLWPTLHHRTREREKPDRHTGKQATGDKRLHREAHNQDTKGTRPNETQN